MISPESVGMLEVFKKRQRIIAVAFIVPLVGLIVVAIYGAKYIASVKFLMANNNITVQELYRTLSLWFIALLLAIGNYSVIFITWFMSDKSTTKALKRLSNEIK